MTELMKLKHWQVNINEEGIVCACIDRADSSANTLNQEIMMELDQLLDTISNNDKAKGVIFCSAKDHFIMGADISQFSKLKDYDEALDLIKKGQAVLQKLEDLKIPSVALIKGLCLGGGMELALACDYRIAENSSKTRLGLPEVKLGIHPGWGGTVRLPRLIGPVKAFGVFILTGSMKTAISAKKLGVVDAAVPERQLRNAAKSYIMKQPRKRDASFSEKILNMPFLSPLIAKKMRAKVAAKAKPQHYPAPFAVIDNWQKVDIYSKKAYEREAESIASLLMTDTCRNLVRVFGLQEHLKGLAKADKKQCQHVHVIGAGTMGGDIAAWCALQGIRVTLQDREAKFIAPAIQRAHKLFQKKLRNKAELQAAIDRLIPDIQGNGVCGADVIIEAIFENLEAKQHLFQDLEKRAKKSAILATNTSSIPLDEINTVLKKPERLVGIHFFNPVAMMMLVEVVKGSKTDEKVVQQSMTFVKQISKLPLPVKSSPGFLVNRVLMPYLMECMYLVDEGNAIEDIDAAAENFGMPMGPIELADNVGLDICLSVAKNLTQHFGGEIPTQLTDMVSAGKLGRKSKHGFYEYKNGKPQKGDANLSPAKEREIADRLIFRMLNEGAACLREGVVESSDLLDAGMIFGTGFAPFRGGPAYYAQSFDRSELDLQMADLASSIGERFTIDDGMAKLQAS